MHDQWWRDISPKDLATTFSRRFQPVEFLHLHRLHCKGAWWIDNLCEIQFRSIRIYIIGWTPNLSWKETLIVHCAFQFDDWSHNSRACCVYIYIYGSLVPWFVFQAQVLPFRVVQLHQLQSTIHLEEWRNSKHARLLQRTLPWSHGSLEWTEDVLLFLAKCLQVNRPHVQMINTLHLKPEMFSIRLKYRCMRPYVSVCNTDAWRRAPGNFPISPPQSGKFATNWSSWIWKRPSLTPCGWLPKYI